MTGSPSGRSRSVLAASNLPSVQRERQLLRELRERSAPPDQASFLLAAYACKANSAWESVEELLAEHEEAVKERGLRPAEGICRPRYDAGRVVRR